MALRIGQSNFSKGVISDELVARIDVAAYASGLKRAENVIILKYGGVTKRPGTRLVAEVYKKSIDADFTGVIAGDALTVSDCVGAIAIGQVVTNGDGDAVATVTGFGSGTGGNGTYLVTPSQTLSSTSLHASVGAPVRLIPFQFSIEQTYALEMGQGYMRPAANGGLVIEDRLTITDLTPGVTTTVEAAFHDYEIGDQVYFAGVEGATELNGRIGRVIAAPDDDHFTVDIDSTGFSAFTGDTGGTTRIAPPPPAPPPPPVPPPAPTPTPPPTGGGGGGGGGLCVADDTLILLPDGSEKQARFLAVGELVHTQHETTLAWGDWPVTAIAFAWQPVWLVDLGPHGIRATGDHRFWVDGAWVTAADLGTPDGSAWVAKITVAEAHTYVSAGVLSHNIKENQEPF